MIGTEANTGQEGKCPTCGNVAVEPFCKCEMRRLKAENSRLKLDNFWVRNHQLMAERDHYRKENARLRKVVEAANIIRITWDREGLCRGFDEPKINALCEALAALDEDKGEKK